jgi:hypothetical protein
MLQLLQTRKSEDLEAYCNQPNLDSADEILRFVTALRGSDMDTMQHLLEEEDFEFLIGPLDNEQQSELWCSMSTDDLKVMLEFDKKYDNEACLFAVQVFYENDAADSFLLFMKLQDETSRSARMMYFFTNYPFVGKVNNPVLQAYLRFYSTDSAASHCSRFCQKDDDEDDKGDENEEM